MALSVWENNRPEPDEFGDSYQGYIDQVTAENVIQALIKQGQKTYALIQQLTDEEADYRYADGKWSVREVLGHIIDTERIMAYRALCISRGETTPLPGFDQDDYVENANFGERSLQSLSAEYDALRNANISLFNSFDENQIMQTGTASGFKTSVRALAYIIAGHEKHHHNILEEKYDVGQSGINSED